MMTNMKIMFSALLAALCWAARSWARTWMGR